MSYRLIDANAIAIKYPEVNEMDCIYVDLPKLDNQYHVLQDDNRLKPKEPIFKTGESLIGIDYIDKPGDTWISKWAEWCCPTCGWFVGEQYLPRRHNQQKSNYCSRCGQAIDWDGIEPEKYARYEKKQQQISEFKKIDELMKMIVNGEDYK